MFSLCISAFLGHMIKNWKIRLFWVRNCKNLLGNASQRCCNCLQILIIVLQFLSIVDKNQTVGKTNLFSLDLRSVYCTAWYFVENSIVLPMPYSYLTQSLLLIFSLLPSITIALPMVNKRASSLGLNLTLFYQIGRAHV